MQYIVMDMEWNQPISFQSAAYRKASGRLLFEVIQIGAVKLNRRFKVVEQINLLIAPTHYQTIHSRVRRITGITEEVLQDAPDFLTAMAQFEAFCGKDCAYLTWGCDDISVLKQNADFFGYDKPLPPTYDVQKLYAAQTQGRGQVALKTAMEDMDIQEDEERRFHNALDDAYYTALVFSNLKNRKEIQKYEQKPRVLAHHGSRNRFRATHTFDHVAEALKSNVLTTPMCPTCNQPSDLQTALIPQAQGKYVALSKCKQHGLLFVKARFASMPSGQKGLHLSVATADRQTRSYVHTKELQYQYKCAHHMMDDYDIENLSSFSRSNMPFDEM